MADAITGPGKIAAGIRQSKIFALEETINVHEMEAKASRETIMRLASEVNRDLYSLPF